MDRRLGRPLPHQLPNPTRANPLAINLSPEGHIRYYSQFPEAIPYQRVCSHALLTRPPLASRRIPVRLACVRPAASVHSEPGSNSQVESSEKLSLTSNLRTSASGHKPKDIFCSVLQLSKQQKPQNSEAVTWIIAYPSQSKLPGRYAAIRRRCAQTARISLHHFKMSKSEDTKHTAHQNFWRICLLASRISLHRSLSALSEAFRTAFPRPVRFGKAVFRAAPLEPQEEKTRHVTISCQSQRLLKFFIIASLPRLRIERDESTF